MFLEVNDVHKQFGTETVLAGVVLSLEAHQTMAILGRSGCGKTTLLKVIAGLIQSDRGRVTLDGLDVTDLPPQKRGIVYLYQETLLFPHLNVFENIAFGLRLQRLPNSEITSRTSTMIEALELADHATKEPGELSGGQRQRVAFGRAIIVNPALLLLDEPFGKLDVEIRATMQQLFKNLASAYKITTLFVTHDLKEALLMGDRMAYMQSGRLRTYANQSAFIEDPTIGVQNEIDFWTELVKRESS